MSLEAIRNIVELIVITGASVIYIVGSFRRKSSEYDGETITRLNNAIDALEKENEILKRENEQKDARLNMQQKQIDSMKEDIQRLSDLATNQTAINEVKATLKQFEFIIPLVPQLQQQLQQMNHDLLQGLKETRDIIRKRGKEA